MRRLTLAGQLLALQMGIVVLVVLAVAGVSMAQIDATFRDSESRRMLSSAETLAKYGVVRQELATGTAPEAMSTQAEITRTYAGADYVITLDDDGTVRSSTLPCRWSGSTSARGPPSTAVPGPG